MMVTARGSGRLLQQGDDLFVFVEDAGQRVGRRRERRSVSGTAAADRIRDGRRWQY